MKSKIYIILSFTFLLFFSVYEKTNAQAPNWLWAKSGTGPGYVTNMQIKSDGNGDILVTGGFDGSTLTFDSTVLGNSPPTATDIFLVKYNSNGNALWGKRAGGGNSDRPNAITTDFLNNIYVAGFFNSQIINFDTIQLYNALPGYSDMFIAKYSPNGNILWCKSAGVNDNEEATAITTDASGNVYVAGIFHGTTITFDTTVLSNAGKYDMFLVKYDSTGNVIWAKSFGGINDDAPLSMSMDNAGNFYMTGYFTGPTILFDSISLTNTTWGGRDLFITKYDSSGGVIWAKSVEGGLDDEGTSLSLDASANIYIAGDFKSTSIVFANDTLLNTSTSGFPDAMIAKFDSSGNVQWARSTYGTRDDFATSITTDPAGNSCITGYFASDTMIVGSANLVRVGTLGSTDIFILKYDNNGNSLWAFREGGTDWDGSNSITQNLSGDYFVTGSFMSPTLTFGSTTLVISGGTDVFIAKLDSGISNSNCSALYTLYPDTTTAHNWFALNQCTGTPPLSYVWNWGDGSAVSTGATPTHVYADSGYYNICVEVTDGNGCVNIYCDSSTYIYKGNSNSMVTLNVVMSLPTGIENIDGASLVTLYPNPATNHLTITLPKISQKVNVVISDITGKAVYSITDASTQKLEVNTKDFSDGVYFVRIQTADFIETRKLIIAK